MLVLTFSLFSATLDCPAQAKGHFFGCKNLGVGKEDVRKAVQVISQIGKWRTEPLDTSRMPFLSLLDKWEK